MTAITQRVTNLEYDLTTDESRIQALETGAARIPDTKQTGMQTPTINGAARIPDTIQTGNQTPTPNLKQEQGN